ncbi:hypothetical protein FJY90_04155 [Candidatus Gottesmanbacteria bacterium]|nr:hypothetical protein [Candidatus Gottesmanbacteria bacterium]
MERNPSGFNERSIVSAQSNFEAGLSAGALPMRFSETDLCKQLRRSPIDIGRLQLPLKEKIYGYVAGSLAVGNTAGITELLETINPGGLEEKQILSKLGAIPLLEQVRDSLRSYCTAKPADSFPIQPLRWLDGRLTD